MKLYIIIIITIFVSNIIRAQNYFPLDTGYINCVHIHESVHCHGGFDYIIDTYRNGGVIKDTLIEGKIFYECRYGKKDILFYYNQEEQILYFRTKHDGVDTTLKAFNFNLDVGESDTSWFEYNSPLLIQLTTKSIVYVNSVNKIYLEYDFGNFRFIEDIGLLGNGYWDYFSICESEVKETLISVITDSLIYNRIELYIESTNLMDDTPISSFPFDFKVNFFLWSQQIMLDSFYVELNLIRNDSIIFTSFNDIQKDSFSVMIQLDSSTLKANDTIAYRVYVNDTTIFHNSTSFPINGYKKIKVLNPVTDVVELKYHIQEFFLSQNFPNPFNPGTKISWQSPVGSWQTLKVYDVLGREVAALVDEYKEAGYHEVEFNSDGLASGIYYYQLKAGSYVQTKKMMVIK